MARIAGVDLPREKRVEIGLTYIYGIGLPTSKLILERGRRPQKRSFHEHQAPDGDRLLQRNQTQKKPARSRTEHQEQQPHPQGSQEDGWPQEEVGRRR